MTPTKELKPPHWLLGTVLLVIFFPCNCAKAMRSGKTFIAALRNEWSLLKLAPMAGRHACVMWKETQWLRDGAKSREDERLERLRNPSKFRGDHHDDGETSVCE